MESEKEKKVLKISQDYLLGKKLKLSQPLEGHRFGSDAVWLASAIWLKEGACVLEVGCGVGAALFCLGWRFPELSLTGVEREKTLLDIADENAKKNGFATRTRFIQGDIFERKLPLVPQSFDAVMVNPPFMEAGQTRSSSALKARAYHSDKGKKLQDWLWVSLKYLKPRGTFTVIHRADRMDHLLQGLKGRVGDLKILPIVSKEGQVAKRILLSGRKGVHNPCTLMSPLVVHERSGGYTPEAIQILEHGQGLRCFTHLF